MTSQLFLPETLSEFLYTQAQAYAREQPRDTLNRTDGIAIAAADRKASVVGESRSLYSVALTVVVDRNAVPASERGLGRSGGG